MFPKAFFVQCTGHAVALVAFHHETDSQLTFGNGRSAQLAGRATRRVEFGHSRVGCRRPVALEPEADGRPTRTDPRGGSGRDATRSPGTETREGPFERSLGLLAKCTGA